LGCLLHDSQALRRKPKYPEGNDCSERALQQLPLAKIPNGLALLAYRERVPKFIHIPFILPIYIGIDFFTFELLIDGMKFLFGEQQGEWMDQMFEFKALC
jgi:hypothetical protein